MPRGAAAYRAAGLGLAALLAGVLLVPVLLVPGVVLPCSPLTPGWSRVFWLPLPGSKTPPLAPAG